MVNTFDFDLNKDWEDELVDYSEENDVIDDVNNETPNNEASNDDVVEDAPPIIKGGFVEKVVSMLNEGCIDSIEVTPPTIGMTFVNGDEFAALCYMYAYKLGFQLFIRANVLMTQYKNKGVKRNAIGKKEPRFYMMKRIRLCCTMGAEHKKEKGNQNNDNSELCKVVIEAYLKDDFLVISQCRLEHNHKIDPANSRHMVGYRLFGEYFKRRALLNDSACIPISKNFHTLVREVGGHANLPFNDHDIRNMVNLERKRSRIDGDAVALEERFLKLKEIDPDFYYAIESDVEGKLMNVFWADGRCRGMAKSFGDAVSYDATFLCNRYKMPFTPFVGVNHHGSTIVFAAALISHEDAVSFTWVFRKWLDCMGRPPSVIITDQYKGIGKAVSDVFPGTPHRLCLWHMLRNASKNLGAHTEWKNIDIALRKAVHECLDPDEFEKAWFDFVYEYHIQDNSWIKDSYVKRESWVPLYWRDNFCASMSSTQRSEQTNRFFKGYVNPETTLFVFLENYENALKTKVKEELKLNFVCLDRPCQYDKSILVEEVFHRVYTNNMFTAVKEEVQGLLFTNVETELNIGSFTSFVATEEVTQPSWVRREKKYNVTIDMAIGEFSCTCKLFEFKGILCRHIIRVILLKKIQYIPEKYILSRWRKDLVRGYEHLRVGYYTPDESSRLQRSLALTLKNDYIYRLALQDDESYAIYERGAATLVKELEDYVGIETLNSMGAGSDITRVWGRRRLQRRENNQRHMVRNANPAREGGLKDPVDKRGTGRAPRPRQKTVRRALTVDEAGSSQPTPQRRRGLVRDTPNTQ